MSRSVLHGPIIPVMDGLDPAIHVFGLRAQIVDARTSPGHDVSFERADQKNGRQDRSANDQSRRIYRLRARLRAQADGRGRLRPGQAARRDLGLKGPHASGHCYFTLKDDNACIEAVIWRSTFARLKFKPEAGLEVVAQRPRHHLSRLLQIPDRHRRARACRRRRADGAARAAQEDARRRGPVRTRRARRRCRICRASSASSPRRPAPSSATSCIGSPTAFPAMSWCGRSGCRARPAPLEVAAAIAGFNAFVIGARFRAPTSSSSRAAAAASRTCGASTRRSWRARSPPAPSRSSRRSATRPTGPSSISSPTGARRRRPPPPSVPCRCAPTCSSR